MVPVEEAATPTITRRRLTSTVWRDYTINRPADGGAPTATCLACGLTLCAGSNNGTSHLHRHTKSDKCQRLAAERVELGRRQPTSPPTTAAEPSSPGNNDDYYSPSPPVVTDDEEEKDLFTVDGIDIPELYNKLIAEGLHNIEQSSESAEHLSAASNCACAVLLLAHLCLCRNWTSCSKFIYFQAYVATTIHNIWLSCADVPAVPQAASSSTRWFINKTKERQVYVYIYIFSAS
jgi:hypothetical protein